jgi:CPA2 family monovalent cation:H+ antiporter-2
MESADLLRDLVVLLGASLPIVLVFQRLSIPSLVGFIAAGMVIGPSGTGLIGSPETVDALAGVGAVLLLFGVGLDVRIAELGRGWRDVVSGGTLQIGATVVAVTPFALAAGFATVEAVTIGLLAAFSSTVIVLKMLSDRADLETPHGRLSVGILIFQDLFVLPVMLFLPLLAQSEEMDLERVGGALATAVVATVAVFLAARIAFPAILRRVAELRMREVFVGTVVLLCLGTAWLFSLFGVSLAIGAFVAGLVVSESEYSHQVLADVVPFRDLLSSVFFVSIGMLVDLSSSWQHLPALLFLTAAIILLKALVTGAVVGTLHRSARVACVVGLSLAQVGEFSFVLAHEAARFGILSEQAFQLLLPVVVLTMMASPLMVAQAPQLAVRLFSGGPDLETGAADPRSIERHVTIIGYGLGGQHLARVLKATGVGYQVLDVNPLLVRAAARQGEPIAFGDASRPAVLRRVGVEKAAVIVVAISDRLATRHVTSMLRSLNKLASIIVRTRQVNEIEALLAAGADEVIPEELETSVEMFARVLQRLRVPENVINAQVEVIRSEHYAALRGFRPADEGMADLRVLLEMSTVQTALLRDESFAVGRTIRELDVRHRTDASIVAVARRGRVITNPADTRLETGDLVVLFGDHASLTAAAQLLESGE